MRTADNLPLSFAVVTKAGNLNFVEPSGPVTALLYLYLCFHRTAVITHFRCDSKVRNLKADFPGQLRVLSVVK